MPNPILTKTFLAGAAITANRLVKIGAADNTVIEAVDQAAAILGVSPNFDVASGARIDVQIMGVAKVKAGAAITRGLLISSEADGQGAVASLTGDTYVAGVAFQTAADGDLIDMLLAQHFIAGA